MKPESASNFVVWVFYYSALLAGSVCRVSIISTIYFFLLIVGPLMQNVSWICGHALISVSISSLMLLAQTAFQVALIMNAEFYIQFESQTCGWYHYFGIVSLIKKFTTDRLVRYILIDLVIVIVSLLSWLYHKRKMQTDEESETDRLLNIEHSINEFHDSSMSNSEMNISHVPNFSQAEETHSINPQVRHEIGFKIDCRGAMMFWLIYMIPSLYPCVLTTPYFLFCVCMVACWTLDPVFDRIARRMRERRSKAQNQNEASNSLWRFMRLKNRNSLILNYALIGYCQFHLLFIYFYQYSFLHNTLNNYSQLIGLWSFMLDQCFNIHENVVLEVTKLLSIGLVFICLCCLYFYKKILKKLDVINKHVSFYIETSYLSELRKGLAVMSTSFFFKYSYAVTLAGMIAWSVVFRSYLSLMILVLACGAWISSQTQKIVEYLSIFLSFAATLEILLQYVMSFEYQNINFYDVNLSPDDSWVRSGFYVSGPSYFYLPLMMLFNFTFVATARRKLYDLLCRDSPSSNEIEAMNEQHQHISAAQTSTPTEAEASRYHIEYIFDFCLRVASKFWMIVCSVALLWIALMRTTYDSTSIFSIMYMAIFLFQSLLLIMSARVFTMVFWHVGWISVFSSMIWLLLIYCLQFDFVYQFITTRIEISSDWLDDIGFHRYQLDNLEINLMPIAIFTIVTVVQLRFFNKELSRYVDMITSNHPSPESSDDMNLNASNSLPSGGDERVIAHDQSSTSVVRRFDNEYLVETRDNRINVPIHSGVGFLIPQKPVWFTGLMFWVRENIFPVVICILRFLIIQFPAIFLIYIFYTSVVNVNFLNLIMALICVILAFSHKAISSQTYVLICVFCSLRILVNMVFHLKNIPFEEVSYPISQVCNKKLTELRTHLLNLSIVSSKGWNHLNNSLAWLGFNPDTNLFTELMRYVGIIILCVFSKIISLTQKIISSLLILSDQYENETTRVSASQRPSSNLESESSYAPFRLFPECAPEEADTFLSSGIFYLGNNFFRLLGTEVTIFMMLLQMYLHSDIISLFYFFCIVLILLVPHPLESTVVGQARIDRLSRVILIWKIFAAIQSFFVIALYCTRLLLPPFLCFHYPWFDLSKKVNDIFFLIYPSNVAPPYVIIGDFVVLLVVIRMFRALKMVKDDYLDSMRDNPEQQSCKFIPLDFVFGSTLYDFIKTCIFDRTIWITAAVLYLVAQIGSSIAHAPYLMISFLLLWFAHAMFIWDSAKISIFYRTMCIFTIAIIFTKSFLKVVFCVFMPDEDATTINLIMKLLSMDCIDVENKTIDSSGNEAIRIVFSMFKNCLGDFLCFFALLLQHRVFLCCHFRHVVVGQYAFSHAASRIAALISQLNFEQQLMRANEEKKEMKVIKLRIEYIRTKIRLMQSSNDEPTDHMEALYRGDHMFLGEEVFNLSSRELRQKLTELTQNEHGDHANYSSRATILDEFDSTDVSTLTTPSETIPESSAVSVTEEANSESNHVMVPPTKEHVRTTSYYRFNKHSLTATDSDDFALQPSPTDRSENNVTSQTRPRRKSAIKVYKKENESKKIAKLIASIFESLLVWLEQCSAPTRTLYTKMRQELEQARMNLQSQGIRSRQPSNLHLIQQESAGDGFTVIPHPENTNNIININIQSHSAQHHQPRLSQASNTTAQETQSAIPDSTFSAFNKLNFWRRFISSLLLIISGNTEFVAGLLMIFNNACSASILSCLLPVLYLLLDLPSSRRHGRCFWLFVIAYVEIVVISKYIFALTPISKYFSCPGGFWETVSDYTTNSPRNYTCLTILFGVTSNRTSSFSDLLLLFVLFVNRAVLKHRGLWKDASSKKLEPDSESILSHEVDRGRSREGSHVQRSQPLDTSTTTTSTSRLDPSMISSTLHGTTRNITGEDMLSIRERPERRIQSVRIASGQQHHHHSASSLLQIDDNANFNLSCDIENIPSKTNIYPSRSVESGVPNEVAGDGGGGGMWNGLKKSIKSAFEPRYSTIDVYPAIFLCQLASFITIAFSWTAFSKNRTTSADNIAKIFRGNIIPPTFLGMLISQFLLMICDRLLFFKRLRALKIIYTSFLVIFIHIYLFFVVPLITKSPFTSNLNAIIMYILQCLYFIFSGIQVKLGYPRSQQSHFLMKHYSLKSAYLFYAIRIIPFLLELDSVMHWLCTKTSLSLNQWIKVEDVFARAYIMKCFIIYNKSFPRLRGEPYWVSSKVIISVLLIFVFIFVIWFPILLMSFISVVYVSRPPTFFTLSVSVSGYPPFYTQTASRGQIKLIKPSDMNNLLALVPPRARDPAEVFLQEYRGKGDLVMIALDKESSNLWAINPDSRRKLIADLKSNHSNSVILRITYTFGRDSSDIQETIAKETVSGYTSFDFSSDREMTTQFQRALNDTNLPVPIPEVLTTILRVPYNSPVIPLESFGKGRPISMYMKRSAVSFNDKKPNTRALNVVEGDSTSKPSYKIEWWSIDATDAIPINTSDSGDESSSLPRNICSSIRGHMNEEENMRRDTTDPPETSDCNFLFAFIDFLPPKTLSYFANNGVIGLYIGFVWLVGRFIRPFFDDVSFRIIYNDMPDVDYIIDLCKGLYVARCGNDLITEEDLYAQIIFLYRSPDSLIKVTKYKRL